MAAAVSDYYVPNKDLSVNKIQSSDNDKLTITLSKTPNFLKLIKEKYNIFLINFKLETDYTLLHSKMKECITKNNSDIVIGNLLQTRYQKVYITKNNNDMTEISKPNDNDIEHSIVLFLNNYI